MSLLAIMGCGLPNRSDKCLAFLDLEVMKAQNIAVNKIINIQSRTSRSLLSKSDCFAQRGSRKRNGPVRWTCVAW